MADAPYAQCKRDGSMCLEKAECLGSGCPKPGDEARQRLIAAAPELLEALLAVLPHALAMINENHPATKLAHAAIAKAIGSDQ